MVLLKHLKRRTNTRKSKLSVDKCNVLSIKKVEIMAKRGDKSDKE